MNRRPEHHPSTPCPRGDERRELSVRVELAYIGGPFDGLVVSFPRKLMPLPDGTELILRSRQGFRRYGYASKDVWEGQDALVMEFFGELGSVPAPGASSDRDCRGR